MKRIKYIIICIVNFESIVLAQTPPTLESLLGGGIFFQGGFGHLALRDEYISKERYSGSLPYFEGGWLKSHDSSAVRFGLEFRSSSTVKNNSVSAEVVQGGVSLDYIYPIGRFHLFARDVYAFLGPSMEMYYYNRTENIARGGSASYNSYVTYYSLSVNSILILPLGSDLSSECSGVLNLIGWGKRSITSQNNGEKAFKPISIFSGIRGSTNILLRYSISEALLLKAGYRIEFCQLTSWDYLLSVSDNLIIAIMYRL